MASSPHLSVPPVALAFALLVAGCPSTESVGPSLIEDAERRAEERTRDPEAGDGAVRQPSYVKREGLHVDMPFMAGRLFAEIDPTVLKDQLGEVMIREPLPEDQDHVVCQRAEVWLYRGRVYRVKKRLPHPMDLPTALGTSGFPLEIGVPIEATRELRWNRTNGMRRIRLVKFEKDPRLFEEIDVVKFLPRELR